MTEPKTLPPLRDAGGTRRTIPLWSISGTEEGLSAQSSSDATGDPYLRFYPYFAGVLADAVALRSSPGEPSPDGLVDNAVATLEHNARLVVEGRTGRWLKVRVESGTALGDSGNSSVGATGLTGYVAAELVAGDATAQADPAPSRSAHRAADVPAAKEQLCRPRPAGEAARSRSLAGILPVKVEFHPAKNQLDVVDFAVNSSVLPKGVAGIDAWQLAMSLMAGDPFARVAVTGFTDCVGDDTENLGLRQERARAAIAAMPAAVSAKVLFSGSSSTTDFIDTNLTEEGRARNRSARVTFSSVPPTGQDSCDTMERAHTIDEYLFLVRCLEARLGLTSAGDARTALSVLRQIYYGSAAWSRSRNWVWDRVITGHPWSPGTDPTAALHPRLMAALKHSQEVEGIDIGHILTGMDAMLAPEDVLFTKGPIGLRTNLANEEWATWAGDVGSAAAEWAWDAFMVRPNYGAFAAFFSRYAGDADLSGDIDGFAIRAGLAASPSAQLMRPLQLTGSLSSVLLQYFRITNGSLGAARARRIQDFAEAYGGVVVNRTLTNRAAVIARLRPSVEEFADYYLQWHLYKSPDTQQPPSGAPPLNVLLNAALDDMVPRFVNWLATQMQP
ncbi:hypothetical protein OG407_49825 [Streptomyces sp. NBC_01515]|uniref:OmpA family protein n=1 Tax=Streptomyces sp. NBC_01515 TaxID=2903890 RepID=UPI003866CBBB